MIALFFLYLISTWANPAAYYIPPCIEQRDSQDDKLEALHHCLISESRPPFKEPDKSGVFPVCPKEMTEFFQARRDYRVCLESPISSKTNE